MILVDVLGPLDTAFDLSSDNPDLAMDMDVDDPPTRPEDRRNPGFEKEKKITSKEAMAVKK